MSFRTRLLLIVTIAVALAAAAGTWILIATTTSAFQRLDEQRRVALVEQFRREFETRGQETARRLRAIAQTEALINLAVDVGRARGSAAESVDFARQLALEHGLDHLEIVSPGGQIVSSAQWPARFGYPHPGASRLATLAGLSGFLSEQETPQESGVAMMAVEVVKAADSVLFLVGGQRLNADFLATVALPSGMRLFLFRVPEGAGEPVLLDSQLRPASAMRLQPLVKAVIASREEQTAILNWSKDEAESETMHAIPLMDYEDRLLAVLLVGSTRSEIVDLRRFIGLMGLIAGVGGVALGIAAGWRATRQVSQPIQKLAEGARKVARGYWDTRVYVPSTDEIGDLAAAFNQMTQQLVDQRERLVQAERVAAWRELARRLAHELKNPLFPLQITVENLQRAKLCFPEQFDEVFEESTSALLTELRNLKSIIANFSEFAKMPQPNLQSAGINELVSRTATLFEPQIRAHAGGETKLVIDLAQDESVIECDPDLISRVLQNLILNALDAMPAGGRLLLRTVSASDGTFLEVSDTGVGLTAEERDRIFTPYYTTKHHGTGLGLAIVQSIISDHGGRISVESQSGKGTTFRIWLRK